MRDFSISVSIVRNSYLRSHTLFGVLQSATRTLLCLGVLLSSDSTPAEYFLPFALIALALFYLAFLPATSSILGRDYSFPVPVGMVPRLLGLLSSVRIWEMIGPLAVYSIAGSRALSAPDLVHIAVFFLIAIFLRWAVDTLLAKGMLESIHVTFPTATCALLPVFVLWGTESTVASAAVLPLASIAIGPIIVTWGELVGNLSRSGPWRLLAALPGACTQKFRWSIARNTSAAFIGISGTMLLLGLPPQQAAFSGMWSAVLICLAARLFFTSSHMVSFLVLLLTITAVGAVFQVLIIAAKVSQTYADAHFWLAFTALVISLLVIFRIKDHHIVSALVRST